jgi:hypothetical protein
VAVYCPATDDKNAAEAKSAKDTMSKDTTGDAERTGKGAEERGGVWRGGEGRRTQSTELRCPLPFIVLVRALERLHYKKTRPSAFLAASWQVQAKGISLGSAVEMVDHTSNL